jgi:phytol kinase
MIPVWAGILGALGMFGAVLGGVRWWQVRYDPAPETPRKFVHVAMGLIALTFPWVFATAWPVILLGTVATCLLLAIRLMERLRNGLGGVLHAIERQSFGEMVFPAAVATVFWLAAGDKVAYVVPVLMLTLADATAAVVGLRYGVPRFATTEEPKSWEGSAAFFVVAFASALVPLLLGTDIGRAEVLLISTILGILAATIEAVSWQGLDNFLVPVGAFIFLGVHRTLPSGTLVVRLVVLLLLLAFGLAWRRRTTLSHRGVVHAALICYLVWALGYSIWLLAPVALFLTYALVPPLTDEERAMPHDAQMVSSNVTVGLAWLFAAQLTHQQALLYPYTVAFAAHLSENGMNRVARVYTRWPRALQLGVATLQAGAFILLPWALLDAGPVATRVTLAAVGLACGLLAALAALALEIRRGPDPVDLQRGWMQAAVAGVLSLVALGGWLAVTRWW